LSGHIRATANDAGVCSRIDWAGGHIPLALQPSRCDAAAPFSKGGFMQRLTFELDRDFVELNQLLKLTGLCDSGGAGKQLVASGAVRVDGVVELRKTCKIHAGQQVALGDVEIEIVAVA
jgi:ribosome-associated protein